MSICSKHRTPVPGCRLCETDIRDALPGYGEKLAEAKAVGEETCRNCGFVYYRTARFCPKCSAPRLASAC